MANKSGFNRSDSLFSLCGLNCGLCPMNIRGECGGCFTDSPCYTSCPIAPCSVRHGNVEYCFQCGEYPCPRYDGIDLHDSLISHRNQKRDLEKASSMGIEAYLQEQRLKRGLLEQMLSRYDDGGRDDFLCLAANMLDVGDLSPLLEQADRLTAGMALRERADYLEERLRACAKERGIPLELRC